jgi:3-hydroxyisobutyrate dehydrogenase-like beta-hydroxyacid dehydrogenase
MGQAMARRLLGAGHELMLYNRTAEKLSELVAEGAQKAASIAEAARFNGLVLSMVMDDAALRKIAEGPGGLLDSLPAGGIHVAMGTHGVEQIRSLAAAHAQASQILISAPVLGRPEAVTAGRVSIIVAGDPGAVARCHAIFDSLGRRVFSVGADPGTAAATKLANNFLLACAIEALGEAFSLVEKCGVDGNVLHDVVTDGMFSSIAYNTYARLIANRAWDTAGVTADIALKDVNLALAAGNALGVPLPSAGVCRERLLGAISHGDGQRDWSVVALEQARASGLA